MSGRKGSEPRGVCGGIGVSDRGGVSWGQSRKRKLAKPLETTNPKIEGFDPFVGQNRHLVGQIVPDLGNGVLHWDWLEKSKICSFLTDKQL